MTKEEAKKILVEYVKACREDDMLTLEQFAYEEVIEAMNIGAEAISVLSVSSGLEEAANEYEKANTGIYPEVGQTSIRDAFIDGAEWQKQHDAELIEIAYNDGITIGMTKQKEQMMKDAVEGEVIVPIYEGNDIWSAEVKMPGRYEVGDKVRIIIIKKEEDK